MRRAGETELGVPAAIRPLSVPLIIDAHGCCGVMEPPSIAARVEGTRMASERLGVA